MNDIPLHHVHGRAIVLDDLKILYVPVPKAACTSLLWMLAGVQGFNAHRFEVSRSPEVSRSMTIHDMSRWPHRCRVRGREESWLRSIADDPEWFVFTVVREPAARLWSAWQSKLLLREPRYTWNFRSEPWFPRPPRWSGEMLEDFVTFVSALDDPSMKEAHWAPQSELLALDEVGYTHIGHVEQLGDTLDLLAEHLGGRELPRTRVLNRSALPPPWPVLSADTLQAIVDHYRSDYEDFGYAAPSFDGYGPADRDHWHEVAKTVVPLLSELVERNRRILHLRSLLLDEEAKSETEVESAAQNQ